MPELTYSISADIFDKYPGYARGVVLAFGVHNGPSPAKLLEMVRQAEASVRAQASIDTIAEHPRSKAWRDAY